jgi:spermidine synthase
MHWQTIDRALTGDGSELTLCLLGDRYAMRVDGQELMNSASHGSEEKLAVFGCAGLAETPRARVLIGGLGMGFTARAALAALASDAEVVVVECVAAVVRWNREILGHLAGAPLADPRLSVIDGDVVDAIAKSARRYDAILLDVDNGPSALSSFKNRRLYSEDGLRRARRALRPGGVLAVWSTFQDAAFVGRLRAVGFTPTIKRVLAGDGTRRRHVLMIARDTASGAFRRPIRRIRRQKRPGVDSKGSVIGRERAPSPDG